MSSPPLLPRRSWLERGSLAVESALVACGVLTIAGWWLRVDEFLQVDPSLSTFKPNAAIAFVVLGVVLIALEFRARRLALLALIPGFIAAATLIEYALHLDLRCDQLIAADYLAGRTDIPGRMPELVAVCVLASSMVLLWSVTDRRRRARLFTSAVVGSLVAAAGFSTFIGYGAGLATLCTWGSTVAMSPIDAMALLLFGLALVSLAWRDGTKLGGEPPAWSPVPVVIGCLTLSLVLWIGLGQRESAYIEANTVTAMDRFATSIGIELERQMNHLERMAIRMANVGESMPVFSTEARAQWDEAAKRGCRFIEYLDANGRTLWVYPAEYNGRALGFDHHSRPERDAALEAAQRSQAPVVSRTTRIHTVSTSESGLVVYAPIVRERRVVGFVAAEFGYHPLFDSIALSESTKAHYRIVVTIAGHAAYVSAMAEPGENEKLTSSQTYKIADREVGVTLVPLDSTIRQDRRFLPELALLAGFGITTLFGLSVHLARRARAGQRAAELSNKRLFAENEERRRVEARLKVSDERLRLALDSTQIGIFEWSVAAGHVYYSPGLWAMLGYHHTQMPSTVDAWQSLIHPDDLPLYRRRVEAQLNGTVSFIEPEYRVRTHDGDWRWVYSRSKSVAIGVDGRPVRIVGTMQDVTARREAELALRESQAEARKLSLVAAKTDNPVLITSPAGHIEWANEAFCRIMEYSLDEVVGKNPAHFMIGPETNQRTIARIRAAIAQGEGISTDIVNYSKSGRRFHLHVEIQPVRGATGRIENFIAVETDITARVETEHQLRRAKTEADDASRAKSEFLASMSHEIRTPMNGVIGMTSLLMETTLTHEQRDYVNTIRTSGEALLTIINDILDFSKIESGRMELERTPFDLAACIEESLDLFALQATAKKLEIGYHVAADVPPWVVGDVTRLRQVMVNLVNNAVKFTPSGSISVEVHRLRPQAYIGRNGEVSPDPKRILLEFSVRDTGIGIPADRIDRLFKAFSQVDSSTTRKYGGTGLGLAICERLIHLMGGMIRVASTPEHGSTFTFTIATEAMSGAVEPALPVVPEALLRGTVLCIEDHPLTQARLTTLFEKLGVRAVVARDAFAAANVAATLPGAPVMLVVDGGEVDGAMPATALALFTCPRLILYPFGQTAPVAQPDHAPMVSVSKPIRTSAFLQAITTLFQPPVGGAISNVRPVDRTIGEEIPLEVLLAEDNPVNQKVALRFLERLGYRADTVANGLEAVTAMENRRYDLVLMDVQMPEMDGFEATRQIRSRVAADRQPKIVALTANAMQGDRELCVAAGMDDYISKPVKMHEIAAAIRRHFAKRRHATATAEVRVKA